MTWETAKIKPKSKHLGSIDPGRLLKPARRAKLKDAQAIEAVFKVPTLQWVAAE